MKDIYLPSVFNNNQVKITRRLFTDFVDRELHASNYVLDDVAKEFQDDGVEGLKSSRHLLRYKFLSLLSYDKSVLDYGCGDGYGSHLLSKNAKRVVGVDTDKVLISSAIKKYKKDNLIFFPVPHLPTKIYDTKFDLINCVEVLEHIHPDNVDSFVCNLISMLDDKGLIVFSTPRCERTVIYRQSNNFKLFHSHYREYDKDDFISILVRNGLKIDQYVLQKFDGSIVYQIPKRLKFPPISARVWVQIAICSKGVGEN